MTLRVIFPLLLAGCSSTTTVTSSDPFVGHWSCTSTSTTTFTEPLNVPPSTETVSSTTTIRDDGQGGLTIVRDPIDAGPECTLHSTLNADGRSTTLSTGQTCTTANGGTVTYTSGGSTLNPDGTYVSKTAWSYSGTTMKGAPLIGTGSGTGACTKM